MGVEGIGICRSRWHGTNLKNLYWKSLKASVEHVEELKVYWFSVESELVSDGAVMR